MSELPDASARLRSVTKTRKSAVYDVLEESILELKLQPGARLVEADLAAQFGVSKTPIREALLLLQRTRLVELTPFAGARVTLLSIVEYEHLTFLLDSIEQPALSIVAERASDEDLRRLGALCQELSDLRDGGRGPEYRDTLFRLHQDTFALTGNPHLLRVISGLSKLARRYEVAFTHRFADAWDAELQVIQRRMSALEARRPRDAMHAVENGHASLLEMLKSRAQDPDLKLYLSDDASV